MANETKFVTGLWVEAKQTQFGEIVKLSVKCEDFIKFLNENKNEKGYVNIDILSKKENGGKYAKLNDYKPATQQTQSTPPTAPPPMTYGDDPF